MSYYHVTNYHAATICKSLMRPHVDYGYVICDQHFSKSYHERLKLFNIMWS